MEPETVPSSSRRSVILAALAILAVLLVWYAYTNFVFKEGMVYTASSTLDTNYFVADVAGEITKIEGDAIYIEYLPEHRRSAGGKYHTEKVVRVDDRVVYSKGSEAASFEDLEVGMVIRIKTPQNPYGNNYIGTLSTQLQNQMLAYSIDIIGKDDSDE